MKVLIADDHSIVRSGLKMILEEIEEGVEAVEAINFDQAREACENEEGLDLIILDLKMPGAQGGDQLTDLVEKANPTPAPKIAPMIYCPSAPMFQIPARKPRLSPMAISISGPAFTKSCPR